MRIITWNCNGALRKKYTYLNEFKADIIVIQECEDPSYVKDEEFKKWAKNCIWIGSNKNKGIGIFSNSNYKITLLNNHNHKFKYILPILINGNEKDYNLFGIWAMNNKQVPEARYIGQIWFAINYYANLLNDSTILIGDFNSNRIWDYKDRVGNHSDVVNKLMEYDIHSLYHEQNNLSHGDEIDPTFYMFRKPDKPYHIDYCFASKKLMNSGYSIKVGSHKDWIDKSDHVPIIIELNDAINSY